MLKIWNFKLWKVSGVNDTLGRILLGKSISTKDIWQRENLRLVLRDPNLVNATNIINVLVLVLHFYLRAGLGLAPTAYCSWFRWTSHRTLLASPALFCSGNQKGKGSSNSNNWLSVRLGWTNVFKQNDALLWRASKFNSKNVANRLLQGGFIDSFRKFNFILHFTVANLSASNDVIMIFSRKPCEKT